MLLWLHENKSLYIKCSAEKPRNIPLHCHRQVDDPNNQTRHTLTECFLGNEVHGFLSAHQYYYYYYYKRQI